MKYLSALLALTATTILTTKAQGFSDEYLVQACKGFPYFTVICLTDISYVQCDGTDNVPVEWRVPDGVICHQGIVGSKTDILDRGVPSTARTYDLQSYGATVAPTATG
ncbi:hypothetical protein PMZ80_010898 [Knufia obscura]|uniref:Uncharacterized protein n=2 Tax=Knufia TaxID=430999 RepID=A0AAN8EG90_9EURO|nr:hypothetical protein PMZ80_010898 [Knufia obscura]KAK5948900.1 hypothetical protein OHC33_010151 [Knufia fluminis]